jgi:hypothetical protein
MIALGVLVGLVLGGLWIWIALQGRLALRAAGARPLKPGESPRLVSLARGLSSDLGNDIPALWVIERGAANALVCHAAGPSMAVSSSLLESCSRTELEAVVAHCLTRLARRRPRSLQLLIAVGQTHRFDGTEVTEDDVAAARLTRYPPALAAALTKSAPVGGRYAALYLVGEGPGLPSADERARALLDL